MADTSRVLKPFLSFLQKYAPFNNMLPAHQEYLAMHLEQVFYAENDEILAPHVGVANSLYIIKSGCVISENSDAIRKFEPGHCFPINALFNKTAVNFQYHAIKSTICYQLTQSHFEYLMQQSNIFHDFISNQTS